jgi:hypothetical protein
MRKIKKISYLGMFSFCMVLSFTMAAVGAGKGGEKKQAAKTEIKAKAKAEKPAPQKGGDTLTIIARIIEIPGKFAPNDLYNYVYIMKYRVLKVVKGVYKEKEILVGHYNPLIPRVKITDKMDKYVDGNVEKFEEGAKQRLVLILPIEKVWKDAMEDEYFDSEMDKYYAVRADVAK